MVTEDQNPEARALTQRFTEETDGLIALLEGCTGEQWRTTCPGEGWSVGTVANHVSGSFRFITGLIESLVNQRPLPETTQEGIDEGNARYALKRAETDQAETIAHFRQRSEDAARVLATLSDQELEIGQPFTLFGGRTATPRNITEAMLIRHVKSHRAGIQEAIAQDGARK
ncbi:MAG TPA: maleylpyruvate isomerase N-terminal domain-containing protein [Chloroflexota bacterium]|nr:maleylpyruvate isomerase N-terminal domain-containing protein [Chloroflexota bacterium]